MRHRHWHRHRIAKGHDDYRAVATQVRDAEPARAAATAFDPDAFDRVPSLGDFK
jgi:hypothetical protein